MLKRKENKLRQTERQTRRVTRLGEFLPIDNYGAGFLIEEVVAKCFGLLSSTVKVCVSFGLHFGRFFTNASGHTGCSHLRVDVVVCFQLDVTAEARRAFSRNSKDEMKKIIRKKCFFGEPTKRLIYFDANRFITYLSNTVVSFVRVFGVKFFVPCFM
jgi:hypothetical protein